MNRLYKKIVTITIVQAFVLSIVFSQNDTLTVTIGNRAYKTVTIGNQIWMAENLAYPAFDKANKECFIYGAALPTDFMRIYSISVTDTNPEFDVNTHGLYYSWELANELCPEGWHLPSDEEWMELEIYLGMKKGEAKKKDKVRGENEAVGLKLKSSEIWSEENQGNNASGFNALPSGYVSCGLGNTYSKFAYSAYFWSSTVRKDNRVWYRSFGNYSGIFRAGMFKHCSMSVRYIKD